VGPTPQRSLPAALVAALAVAALLAAGVYAQSGGVGPGGDGNGGGGDGGGHHGGDGGDNGSGGGGTEKCRRVQFGQRTLERGDCGSDVSTLNWILKAAGFKVPLAKDFDKPTQGAVRDFQRAKKMRSDGIVDAGTRDRLLRSMKRRESSWYGPGFYGNRTACGQKLKKSTVGVAHRSLPCGTRVVFGYKGRYLRTRVIDRGPYVKQRLARYERTWDLTRAAAKRLRFEGTDQVRSAAIK
jgi:hypothetical protein